MMKRVLILGAMLFTLPVISAQAGGTPVPVIEPTISIVRADGKPQTVEDVHGYIKTGVAQFATGSGALGMNIDSDQPGLLKVTFNKQNKNYFTVAISYDEKNYQVKFVSSQNLDYVERDGVRLIHRHYPLWINELVTKIAAAQNTAGKP